MAVMFFLQSPEADGLDKVYRVDRVRDVKVLASLMQD